MKWEWVLRSVGTGLPNPASLFPPQALDLSSGVDLDGSQLGPRLCPGHRIDPGLASGADGNWAVGPGSRLPSLQSRSWLLEARFPKYTPLGTPTAHKHICHS